MTAPFPTDGMELTHILVVADIDRARTFYRDVLGAEVYREYGGTSCVLRAFGTWLLLVTGGGPTADKPTVTFAAAGRPRQRQPFDDDPRARLPRRVRHPGGPWRHLPHRRRSSPTGRSGPSSAIPTAT